MTRVNTSEIRAEELIQSLEAAINESIASAPSTQIDSINATLESLPRVALQEMGSAIPEFTIARLNTTRMASDKGQAILRKLALMSNQQMGPVQITSPSALLSGRNDYYE